MTNPLAQDLGGVVRLLEDMTPGNLIVYDANEGDGWPPRPLWCFKNEAYDSGEEPALQGGIHYGGKEDADAIAAAINFLRAHSAEIAGALRDAERWQPIESAPPHNRKNYSMGTEYMIWPPPSSGERTAFFGRRLGGKATWYKYGAPVHGVTHWRPLPAPPTQDSAMQQGGGGGEAAA